MTYAEKKQELMGKYATELALIEKVKGVDTGVAWEILDTYGRGLNQENPLINKEELAKDCNDLYETAKAQLSK